MGKAKKKEDVATLAIQQLQINRLTLDPDNARTHPEENLEAIKDSLREFGQRRPVVVQKKGMVVRAGNGLVMAAKELGWKTVAAFVVDEEDRQAIAFAIADNRTAELSAWDERQLFAQLELIESEADDLIEQLGFSEAKRSNLKARFGEVEKREDRSEEARKEDVGTKGISLRFAAPDYNRLKAALEFLQGVYRTDTQEQLILTVVENAAEELAGRKPAKVNDVLQGESFKPAPFLTDGPGEDGEEDEDSPAGLLKEFSGSFEDEEAPEQLEDEGPAEGFTAPAFMTEK